MARFAAFSPLLLALVGLLACDDPRPVHGDDDDGETGSGGTAGARPSDGGGGTNDGGAAPATFGGEVEWQLELEMGPLPRAGGPDGSVFVEDQRFAPLWRVERISAAGALATSGGWPINYSPNNATSFENVAAGPGGEVVLVGGESFGWHVAKIGDGPALEWFRVLGAGAGSLAKAASIDGAGVITVVGSGATSSSCLVTRYLASGDKPSDIWPRTLSETKSCRRVLADDARIYVPMSAFSGSEPELQVIDVATGTIQAGTPLSGYVESGTELGLFTLAPGGGVLIGHHTLDGAANGRELALVSPEGEVLWEQHLPDTTGRIGARTNGELACSVTMPGHPTGTRAAAELTVQWYRRIDDELVQAGAFSLGTYDGPIPTNVIALEDGSFAISWWAGVGSAAERHIVARVRPVAE